MMTAKSYGSLWRSGSSGGENMSLHEARPHPMPTASAATTRRCFTRQVYYNAAMGRYWLVVMAVVGCASSTANAQLQPAAPEALTTNCDDLPRAALAEAIERELPAVTRSKPDYAARVLQPILKLSKADDRAHLCGTLQYSMKWMHVGAERVLFTAYHTPTVRGSLVKDATYRFPLYKRPRDAGAKATTAQILGG